MVHLRESDLRNTKNKRVVLGKMFAFSFLENTLYRKIHKRKINDVVYSRLIMSVDEHRTLECQKQTLIVS